jgi:hypothetical protein
MVLINRMVALYRGLADQAWAVMLALILEIVSSQAGASTTLVSNTTLVSGSYSSVFSFEAPGPGTVTAQLSNLAWPTALNSLTLAATTADQVMGQISASAPQSSSLGLSASAMDSAIQSDSFQVVGGVNYFAHVNAVAGGPLDLGLYSLSITFTPAAPSVPLPSSGWLMAFGLIALVAVWGYLNRHLIATGRGSAVGEGGSAARAGSSTRAPGRQRERPPMGTLFEEWLPTK